MKKVSFLLLSLSFLFLTPITAQAFSTEVNDNIYIGKNEAVDGNFYATGKSITIDGVVSGDVICAAQTITINGIVEGDIIAAAQNINFNGDVKGNIRVMANYLNVNGVVGKNLNVFSSVTTFSKNSKIAWDAVIFSNASEIRGIIEGNLHGSISDTVITGKIGRNVDLIIDEKGSNSSLVINKEAVIAGDLNYTSLTDASIESESSIAGQINKTQAQKKSFNWSVFVWMRIFGIFSALLVALAMWFLWEDGVSKSLANINRKWGLNLLSGLIIFGTILFASVIMAITVIGLPLAFVLLIMGATVFYLGKIISAIFVGNFLVSYFTKKKLPVLSIVIGIIIAWLLFSIPYVGWILSLIALLLGGGALLAVLKEKLT